MRLVYLSEALQDLASIHEYISTENPVAARKVIASIRDQNRILLAQPLIGRTGRIPETRELINSNYPYITAYRVLEEQIEILAVVHTSRRWPSTLKQKT